MNLETENEQLRTRLAEMAAEVERLSHERQCMAEAIGRIAVASGDTRTEFTGPDLLMVCGDAAEGIKHLTAENARLQSVIDGANAQEHIATIGDTWGLFWRGADSIADIAAKHGLRVGDKLYARPIPAQADDYTLECLRLAQGARDHYAKENEQLKAQLKAAQEQKTAPAVAVPDNFNGDDRKLIDCATALLALDDKGILVPHGIGGHARTIIESFVARASKPSPRITEQDDNLAVLVSQELYSNGGAHESQIDVARRIIGFIASRLPQRVTEQDAREIADSAIRYCNTRKNVSWSTDSYMRETGRGLLDKLNGDKNAR